MPYVITTRCSTSLCDQDCVSVCPVDAIHGPGERMFIDPNVCIDCDQCAAACPVGAVFPDHDLPAEHAASLGQNADFFD